MKKIRITNWQKWKFIKHPTTLKPIQAYPNHFNNIFVYSLELEMFLIDNAIEYEIDKQDYTFPKFTKTK